MTTTDPLGKIGFQRSSNNMLYSLKSTDKSNMVKILQMENEARSLHETAVREIVEGINNAQSLHQEYPITLPCNQCGREAVRINAAEPEAIVGNEYDHPLPEHPLDVTVSEPGKMLIMMIDTSDRKEPMEGEFLEELGLETFIKRIDEPEDLEELGRKFRADRGINTEDRCSDCRDEIQD